MHRISKVFAHYKARNPGSYKRCDLCEMWRSPAGCSLVKGLINSLGICRFFERKRPLKNQVERIPENATS